MLHKAARNAYSWWWASHIRTKQSKWLDQNLQDMEEKVEYTLKIIQEDGDTFSQRAEMYYRKRPELVSFVEDSFRGYRALAERYDHLSRELQSANRTVAAICPERIHLEMDNDFDDDRRDHFLPKPDDHQSSFTLPPPPPPELTKPPTLSSSSGKKNPKRLMSNNNQSAPSSGLNKHEAPAEIDKLQKEILALQTEREFVKSSYESALAKYWDIENRASEMQTKVSNLQDEFGIGTVIEDDEARTLMIATALKSCHHTLVRLQEKQRQSTKEVAQEHIKIEETRNKFYSLKEKLVDVNNNDPDETLRMHELEDMVDDFVEKVINLENLVSSQAAQIKRLKSEINNLQSHIQNIEEEEEEENIVTSNYKVRRVEQELDNVQSLLKSVEDQNDTLQTNFTEAECSHDDLNEKLLNVKPDANLEITKNKKSDDPHENYLPGFLQVVEQVRAANANAERELELALSHQQTVSDNKLQQRVSTIRDDSMITKDATRMEDEENRMDCHHPLRGEESEDGNVKMTKDDRMDSQDPKIQAADEKMTDAQNILPDEDLVEPDWKALFLNELDDREKILLQEYTTMLRNYKEVKKKLNEVEKKKRASLFQSAVQVKFLRNANSMKDDEIKSLLAKINLLTNNNERGPEIDNNNFDGKQDKTGSHSPVEEEKGREEINIIDENFSSLEEKIRTDIDDLLEENIEFWLRFSTSFYQIQKFQTSVDDLQAEVAKLKEKNAHSSEIRPIYRHLREIQTELTLWLEHNAVLKDDLQNRLSSLLNLTEEIEKLANTELSNYEAAKFQGEILNMKQENNKVAEQVQAGAERIRRLQVEIQTTLSQLDQQLGISSTNLRNRNRYYKIPLRSFLFGVKLKKQKPSLFSCVSPPLQKQYI